MNAIYSQKSSTVQKAANRNAASVLDSSSQGKSLQRKADMANSAVQREERPNNTGMPDNLKSGIESLSGFSMDDVRVHYNSSKPATVQALAYTQGTDIHVAPGQEKCLPHEAWHVAQQMAGRVSPTTNINGMPVNDNAALEHEADVMGEKAVAQRKEKNGELVKVSSLNSCSQMFFTKEQYDDGINVLDNLKGLSKAKKKHLKKIWNFIKNTGDVDNAVRNNCFFKIKKIIRSLRKYSSDPESLTPFKYVKGLMVNYVKNYENEKELNEETNDHFQQVCENAQNLCQNVLDEKINEFFGRKKTDAINDFFCKTLIEKIKNNFMLIRSGIETIKTEKKYINCYTRSLNTGAYVKPKQKKAKHAGLIRLATGYREAKESGTDSKPGIIIHETSHLVLGTKDYAYGKEKSKKLAREHPGNARKNADSYKYAAELSQN